jgi:hypothetical protein
MCLIRDDVPNITSHEHKSDYSTEGCKGSIGIEQSLELDPSA